MADDDWDDGPSAPAPASNNIGFGMPGAGRGFKAAPSDGVNGFQERKPGGFGGGESKGFGGGGGGFGGGESKGFGGGGGGFGGGGGRSYGGDSGDGEGRRGGGGGYRGGGRGGGGGFGNRNENGESRGFGGGGGGRGFGGGNNDDGEGGGGGYRGGRGGGGGFRGGRGGGGGGFGNRNDEEGGGSRGFGGGGGGNRYGGGDGDEDGGNRGFGGGGRGRGRGGGGGFNRRNDGDEDGGGGGGGRGFGGGGRGGGGGFGRRNDGDEDGGEGGGRGFGGGGGGRGRGGGGGFNRRNDGDEDGGGGGGGGRGFGGGGGGFGRDRGDDGEGGGGRGGRGGGRGGRGGGFGDRGDRDGGGGDGGDGEKPREVYVPPERDENDMYNDGTRAGINFNKYDSIEVKTSGENVPPQINSFEEADLRKMLYDNMKKCGYTTPTPVQKYSIPIVLNGRDLMACAQTGSGKTAAFMVPIIHRLLEKPRDVEDMQGCIEPRAIIIAPTRELAIQTHEAAVKLSKGSVLFARIAYGGAAMGDQMRKMFAGCDILVATPGRLLGLVGMGKIQFNAVEFVVLDEADRMLDMGFLADVEKVLKHETMTPVGERHTLMFSATFPQTIQQLAGKYLHDYVFVAVGIVGGACTDIEQNFIEVIKKEKRSKLKEILDQEKSEGTLKGILVFVEAKRSADFTAAYLSEQGFPTTSIHGDRLQREREEALYDFKSGRMGILVATAVAARGLDIQCARHVINFDLPMEIDEYIHRIGRTGRVGNKGKATSFYDGGVDHRIKDDLLRILNQAGQPVPDWLESGGGGTSFGPASGFGGQDIRSFSDVQDSSRGATQPVEEEEQW